MVCSHLVRHDKVSALLGPCQLVTYAPAVHRANPLCAYSWVANLNCGFLITPWQLDLPPSLFVQEMSEALFHGCDFVPDLLSLQAWLECAWKGGFDTAGGDTLGNAVQHSDQWIGTTECAALLRFFGLKAQIIDFTGEGSAKMPTFAD